MEMGGTLRYLISHSSHHMFDFTGPGTTINWNMAANLIYFVILCSARFSAEPNIFKLYEIGSNKIGNVKDWVVSLRLKLAIL